MGLLDQLLGGGQQQEYQNFMNRYEQGPPWEGVSGQEAYDRFQQVAPRVPPDVFNQAAQESFSRLTPEQRMELGQMLIQQAQQQGVRVPGAPGGMAYQPRQLEDPGMLAQLTTQMHQEQPGILGQLLGGGARQGGSSLLDSPIAKAALAGIATMAVKSMMNRQ